MWQVHGVSPEHLVCRVLLEFKVVLVLLVQLVQLVRLVQLVAWAQRAWWEPPDAQVVMEQLVLLEVQGLQVHLVPREHLVVREALEPQGLQEALDLRVH